MSLQRKSSANITTCNSNGKEWNIVEACRGHETDPMEAFFRKWDIRIRMVVYKFAFGFNPLWVLASWLLDRLDVVYEIPEYSGHMHLFLVLLFMPSPALSIVPLSMLRQKCKNLNMRNFWGKAMCDTRQMQNFNVLCGWIGWMMVTLWRKLIPTSRHSLTHSLHIRQKVKNRAQQPCADRGFYTHTYKIGKHHARCRVMCICINLRCNLSFSNFIRVFVTCFKKNSALSKVSHCWAPDRIQHDAMHADPHNTPTLLSFHVPHELHTSC